MKLVKKIPFIGIPVYLLRNDVLNICGGKLCIKKRLTSIIGGIPVYSFEMIRSGEQDQIEIAETLEELTEKTTIVNDGYIPRCLECDCIPVDSGYYYDNEVRTAFCCHDCLVRYMNRCFGDHGWKEEYDIDKNKTVYYVKREGEFEEYDIEYNALNSKKPIFTCNNEITIENIVEP